jgi:glucosamine-6-phosphate deaminase
MRVLVLPDYRTLSRTAAELVIEAVRSRPVVTLGLPTGSTPLGMYAELAARYRDEHLDFSHIRTFNLDEYFGLPQLHPMSYHSYMWQHFFRHVNAAPPNIHIPDGSPGVDADEECERYERLLAQAGRIDLLVAGIGANAHIAFNEPGSHFDSRTRVVDLTPETIGNAQKHFGSESAPSRAITIGIANILESRRVLLLASGDAKAEAVRRALRQPVSEAVPASALQLHDDVTVLLDEAAAAGL